MLYHNYFEIDFSENITCDVYVKKSLIDCKNILKEFCEENDIIKNEQKFNIQKEERDKIRHHNLRVASGEIDNSMEAVNSKNEDEDNNSSKKKKNKKIAEKKAPEANNVVVTNHSTIPYSDSDNDNDNN